MIGKTFFCFCSMTGTKNRKSLFWESIKQVIFYWMLRLCLAEVNIVANDKPKINENRSLDLLQDLKINDCKWYKISLCFNRLINLMFIALLRRIQTKLSYIFWIRKHIVFRLCKFHFYSTLLRSYITLLTDKTCSR